MRSIVLDKKVTNACGICSSKEPFIEHKEIEGIQFIWCHKCNTINFYHDVDKYTQLKIENIVRKQQTKKIP